MFYFVEAVNIYMAFVMTIFRIHYAVGKIFKKNENINCLDITTGVIVSHYMF